MVNVGLCLLVLVGVGLVVGQHPSCEQPPCKSKCYFHGTCDEMSEQCVCDFGYKGKNCDKRVCDRETCKYGVCNEVDGSCSCDSGYIGAHCDILIGVQPFTTPVCNLDSLCICDQRGHVCTDEHIGPDLFVIERYLQPYVEFKYFDKCDCAVGDCIDDYGMRKLLRFTVMTYNAGPADLMIGNPGTWTDDKELGDIYSWHVCHNHPHFLPWNVFRLVNEHYTNSSGQTFKYVHERSKSGSTVIDSLRSSSLAPGRTRKYVDQRQGLQAGWSDWYPDFLDCQWVDITDLPPGDWTLEVEVNPERLFRERNYENNLLRHPLVCNPQCVHGACDFGSGCICEEGWKGKACDVEATEEDDECVPDCDGKHCGSSGCDGEHCGVCERHEHCKDGVCECSPRCEGKFCGNDGCGGMCGVCLGESEECNYETGQCECEPRCGGKECGFDGCYHVCGTCYSDETCVNYRCTRKNSTRID